MEVNLKSLAVWCTLLFIGVYAKSELDTLSDADIDYCDYNNINICQNGGKCIGTGKESFCKCRRGTSGTHCEIIDDCERKICGQGTDKDVFCLYDQTKDSAVCICKQKDLSFDRIEGECRRPCSTNDDCFNGASCLQEGIGDKENVSIVPYDLKYCRCLPDTYGIKCETVLSCLKGKEFCGEESNATCYFDVADEKAKCACPDPNHVFDEVNKICKECDCGEKGLNCTYKEGVKQCTCAEGFYDVDGICKDCQCGNESVNCLLENGNKHCICNKGFFDVNGECTDCKCGPYATGCSNEDGKKTCQCRRGFKQNGDVCENCNCRRNFKDCDFIDGNMKCTCDEGYAQKEDMCVEACNEQRVCKNGGSCEEGICNCKKGTGGNFCQIVTKCEYDNPCPNVWGIDCVYDQAKEEAICKCSDARQVYVKDEGKCIETCDDEDFRCDLGKCSEKPEGRLCDCFNGTSGDLCDIIDQCRTKGLIRRFCGTNSGASCDYDIEKQKPFCKCEPENQIYIEKDQKCKTTCDDDTRFCQYGGKCKETENGHFCSCLKGTSGDHCGKIDKCENQTEFRNLCGRSKNVNCSYSIEKEEAYCFCNDPSQKFNTQTKKCTITCDESEQKCLNEGKCETTDDGQFCKCEKDFRGDLCNIIDACTGDDPLCGDEDKSICGYDHEKGKAVCKCQDTEKEFDYTLKSCRNQCESETKPCMYGTPCVNSEGNNFCRCPNTLSGDFCDVVNACERNFCGAGTDVKCMYDAKSETNAACKCNDEKKKFDPVLKICRETCVSNSSCKFGNLCKHESSSNSSFCRCRDGLSGDFCDQIDDCKKVCGNGNDVVCDYDIKNSKVVCSCTNETKRFDKVEKMCRVPCNYTDCKNDASCRRYSNDPNRDDSDIGPDDATFCRCWSGSRGDFCEIVDDCVNGKVDCGNDTEAICLYSQYNQKGYCGCADEKKEFNTVTKECLDCDCGPFSRSCSFSKGEKYCSCRDRAYQKNAYCYDCACGDNFDSCYYDLSSKEKICRCKNYFSQNNGICEFCHCGRDSTRCSYTNGEINCQCKQGFVPNNEYCQAACNETHPCNYGGKCVDGLCQCKKGTAGTFCQIVVDCSNNEICGRDEDALCLYDEENEEAYCRCNGTGLIFDEDKKKCVACDCADKGVCSLEGGKKDCTCIPTYGSIQGKCTECNCGDKAKTCYISGETRKCVCEKGFADKNGKCIECDCGERGVCHFDNGKKSCLCWGDYGEKSGKCVECGCGENSRGCTFDKNETACKCKEGFLQHESTCKACDCGKNGICSFDKHGNKECDCNSGYAEKNGKCIEECSDNCENGGKCEEEGDNNFCNCSKGTSGDLCEIIDDCATVYKDCKANLGTCMYNETKQAAYCECDENTIYDEKLKRCRKTCSKDFPCDNGGKCVDSKCQCQEGTSGDLCFTVDGCKALEKKCLKGQGICVYAPNKAEKAECGCSDEGFRFSEEQQGCRAIWCLENTCAAGANCWFDVTTKTGYCACNDRTFFYNSTGKSCNAVDSCMISSNCGKFEICENGKCKCPRYHENTDDGCRPKLCQLHLCYNFKASNCKETDLVGTVDCVCESGMYYNGSQCVNGNCFLPDGWSSCYYGCPDGMERTDTGCQAKEENKTCDKDCGKYGFCLKEGNEEVCKCLPKFAKMASGSCILDASVVCASKKLTKDLSRCECSGILKYAENNITCEKRTCSDKDVQEECESIGAVTCKNNWDNPGMEPGSGYECLCGPGYSKNDKGICTEKCMLENHASECASRGQICILDDLYNANCKCPPTTAWNETAQKCDFLNENTFIIRSLPVVKKKYMKKDGSVHKVLLNADIVNAMKTVYQTNILDYAYLSDLTETESVLNCSVVVQLKKSTKWDIHRVTLYNMLKLNCKNCSVYLLPPLVLDEELFSGMFLEELNFCSDALKNTLCGEGSTCNDNKCSCAKGYRTVPSSVRTADGFTILKCEDVDECSEMIDLCTKNTSCVNTPGDYYCECKPGFKKLSDTYPYKNAHDKENCVDFCSPSPCVKGSCKLQEKGFDCSCDLGYTGSLCDRADEYLKKANTKSKIIGGVLGALLGVTALAFVFYFMKKRKQENSEAEFVPERPADHAEMAERRPPRGIPNRAYE